MELSIQVNPQERAVRLREVHAFAAGDVYNPVTLSGVEGAQTAALQLKLYKDSTAAEMLAQCSSFVEVSGHRSERRGVLTLATQAMKTWYESLANGATATDTNGATATGTNGAATDANGLPSALVNAWLVIADSTRVWAACNVPLILRAMDTNVVQGADGISPTVSVTRSGSVVTISVTDVNGTHTETVNDGQDGADGESPTMLVDRNPVTGNTRITVVNVDGSSSSRDVVVPVDPELSGSSEKPVQNRAVKAALDAVNGSKADRTAFESHAGDTTRHITATERSTWNTKYGKPSGGIPKSDLAAAVQASLGKADTALQAHQDISGKADLVGGKVPQSQLPSYVDDVLEYAAAANFPATGEEGKIYVAKDTNKTYRWSGTGYVQVGGRDIIIDPTLSGTSENPVQNRAVKEAIDARPTKEAIETGWQTAWTILREGVDVTAELAQPRYIGDENDDMWTLAGCWFSGETLDSAEEVFAPRDVAELSWTTTDIEDVATTYHYTATRRRVAGPVPTRTSELENDGPDGEHPYAKRADVALSPMYGAGRWTYSGLPAGWTVLSAAPADAAGEWTVDVFNEDEGQLTAWNAEIEDPAATDIELLVEPAEAHSFSFRAVLSRPVAGYTLPGQEDKPLQPKGNYLTEHQDITGKQDRYPFSAPPATAGTLALQDMKCLTYAPASGESLTVAAPSGASGTVRDMVLVLDCTALVDGTDTAPSIVWPAAFHPRTDAAVDFGCAVGARNVYYISEYAAGRYVVGGWRETAGGSV